MTENDIVRIETELGISLPGAYRRIMVPFRIPACVGNGNEDFALWDNPQELIELNRGLRAGETCDAPWPIHMFALGRDGGGSADALDLRDPAGAVFWVDRCCLNLPWGNDHPSPFEPWAEKYLAALRGDLESDGIDPDGTPEARHKVEAENAKAGCGCCSFFLAVGVLTVIAAWVLALWLE